MSILQGTIKNGQIVLDAPSGLPDGMRVEVVPIGALPTFGMCEEDWPTTPEGVTALLARMDEVETGWLSPQDEAAWQEALCEQKNHEKARFLEDAEKLRGMWE